MIPFLKTISLHISSKTQENRPKFAILPLNEKIVNPFLAISLLDEVQKMTPDAELHVISKADDIDNLSSIVVSANGDYQQLPNKLLSKDLSQKPQLLLIDIDNYKGSPETLKLLLQEPPKIIQDGECLEVSSNVMVRLLGSETKIFEFLQQHQLNDQLQLQNILSFLNLEATPSQLKLKNPRDIHLSSNTQIIDFQEYEDWQTALLGGINLDSRGSIKYVPGCLESLNYLSINKVKKSNKVKKNRGFQIDCLEIKEKKQINLVNAPWDDPKFQELVFKINAGYEFELNGKKYHPKVRIMLEDHKTNLEDNQRITKIIDSLKSDNKEQIYAKELIITTNNFDTYFAKQGVNPQSGELVSRDSAIFDDLDSNGKIVIAESLTQAQWVKLLLHLDKKVSKPVLIINTMQIPHLRLADFIKIDPQYTQVEIIESSTTYIEKIVQKKENAQIKNLYVSPGMTLDSLLEECILASAKEMKFKHSFTQFKSFLENIDYLIINGLEHNQELATDLITLTAKPPYVILQGQYIPLPKLKIVQEKTQHKPFAAHFTKTGNQYLDAVAKFMIANDLVKVPMTLSEYQQFLKTLLKQVELESCYTDSKGYAWIKTMEGLVLKQFQGTAKHQELRNKLFEIFKRENDFRLQRNDYRYFQYKLIRD